MNASKAEAETARNRHRIAVWVLGSAGLGTVVIGALVIVLCSSEQRFDATKYVFVAVLPLLGSWVGTVITFYFNKENLEAATSSVEKLTQSMRGTSKKLQEVLAADKMIERARIRLLPSHLASDAALVSDVLKFADEQGISRLPVFDAQGVVDQMIHVRTLDRIVRESTPGAAPLTLGAIRTAVPPKQLTKPVAFVAQTSTLAAAKAAMAEQPGCEDVFVTKNGSAKEPVLGWITSNTILQVELRAVVDP